MPRTDTPAEEKVTKQTKAPSKQEAPVEAKVDDALDDSFPASDPPSYTAPRGGKDDKKAPLTEADTQHGVKGFVRRMKDQVKH